MFPGQVSLRDIRRTIERAGFRLPEQIEGRSALDIEKEARERELSELRTKLLVSAVLSVLVMIGSFQDMLPGLAVIPSRIMWFILFLLATPVQFWAGRHFYQNAWASLRHGSTNMNTLVVVGTTAAYGYSAVLTFFPFPARAPCGSRRRLLRHGDHDHHPDPVRQVPRSARQDQGRRSDQETDGPPAAYRPGACATARSRTSRSRMWSRAISSWSGPGKRFLSTVSSGTAIPAWTSPC